jgi:hypothetical protein
MENNSIQITRGKLKEFEDIAKRQSAQDSPKWQGEPMNRLDKHNLDDFVRKAMSRFYSMGFERLDFSFTLNDSFLMGAVEYYTITIDLSDSFYSVRDKMYNKLRDLGYTSLPQDRADHIETFRNRTEKAKSKPKNRFVRFLNKIRKWIWR